MVTPLNVNTYSSKALSVDAFKESAKWAELNETERREFQVQLQDDFHERINIRTHGRGLN
ncbi:hypothetical protein EBR66_06180 [bacterium]|nr:hypothetical protein [bacterium]